jgi:hypothetical protein
VRFRNPDKDLGNMRPGVQSHMLGKKKKASAQSLNGRLMELAKRELESSASYCQSQTVMDGNQH